MAKIGRPLSHGGPSLQDDLDDASSSGRFSTNKLDEIEDVVRQNVSPHRLVPSGRDVRGIAAFEHYREGAVGLFNVGYGRQLDVVPEGDHIDNFVVFVMAMNGQGNLKTNLGDLPITGQSGLIFPVKTQKIIQYGSNAETLALMMDRAQVSNHCRALLGMEPGGKLDFEPIFNLEDAAGQNWLRTIQYAKSELSNPTSLVHLIPAAQVQFEKMLMTNLLFTQRHTLSDALLKPQSSAAPRYVKHAEDFIQQNFAEPISLADIAAHVSISARSLQNGFQNFRNMTPMAFLRSIRLKCAHIRLQQADPTAATVTEIALQCGFNHLGEFAMAYKQTYGKTPSDTLWRKG